MLSLLAAFSSSTLSSGVRQVKTGKVPFVAEHGMVHHGDRGVVV